MNKKEPKDRGLGADDTSKTTADSHATVMTYFGQLCHKACRGILGAAFRYILFGFGQNLLG